MGVEEPKELGLGAAVRPSAGEASRGASPSHGLPRGLNPKRAENKTKQKYNDLGCCGHPAKRAADPPPAPLLTATAASRLAAAVARRAGPHLGGRRGPALLTGVGWEPVGPGWAPP